MCLAVLGKVIDTGEDVDGAVDLNGNRVPTNFALVPEVDVGNWVLLHAGFAIRVVPEEEARETLRLLEQLGTLP